MKGHGWTRTGGDFPPEMFLIKVFGEDIVAYRDVMGEFHVMADHFAVKILGVREAKITLRNVNSKNYDKLSDIVKRDLKYVEKEFEEFSKRPKVLSEEGSVERPLDLVKFIKKDGTIKKKINIKRELGVSGSFTFLNEVGLYEAIIAGNTKECADVRTDLAEMLKELKHKVFLEGTTNVKIEMSGRKSLTIVEKWGMGPEEGGGATHSYLERLEDKLDEEGIFPRKKKENFAPCTYCGKIGPKCKCNK